MRRLLLIVICFFASAVSAVSLNNVVMFGDSLSDNGNFYEKMDHQIPMSPPYYNGRFSNGPLWIEQLLDIYYPNTGSLHLEDYAYGGAGVSEDPDDDELMTLKSEINHYLFKHQDKVDENSLVTVWIGANNYLALPDDEESAVNRVTLGIKHSLETLVKKGAKHILVLNLPDLGITPAAIESDSVVKLTNLSKRHNERLAEVVDEARQNYPDVQWVYFDVAEKMQDMIAEPEIYGLTNTTDTCYEAELGKPSQQFIMKMVASVRPSGQKDTCDGYLFFDLVHPTVRAHEVMAKKAKKILDDAGIDFVEKAAN